MVDWGSEFTLFSGIQLTVNIRIDVSISKRSITGTSVGGDTNETNQAGAGDVVTPGSRDNLKPYVY